MKATTILNAYLQSCQRAAAAGEELRKTRMTTRDSVSARRALAAFRAYSRRARFEARLQRICQEYDLGDGRLLAALELYGQHQAGCSGKYAEYRCKCGWRDLAATLRVSEGIEGK